MITDILNIQLTNMARTEISTLGEFGLIKHLTKDLKAVQPSTQKGIGDDAAVIHYKDQRTLVTTDLLLEGIHFNLEYVPLKHLGYKAAVVNFSDIYAMNAIPAQITVSLGVSKRFCVEDLEELYAGIRLACEKYNVDLVGGDTSASMTGLTISITCLGTAYDSDIVYRNGAKVNDLICVTGNLGTAYMGLQLLERERIVMNANENATPAFEGREYLLERQLKPEARRDIIEQLHKAGIKPTAMMDISDGLSSELMHICTQWVLFTSYLLGLPERLTLLPLPHLETLSLYFVRSFQFQEIKSSPAILYIVIKSLKEQKWQSLAAPRTPN